ncbi:YcaO-like family protein [Alloscardovia macacae]|uniref:YcaO-like family n=1 Tax=Alloscardovia macacae TaxID=1160091 RepID=A0A261F3R3_9BIFI|nr:YcaO-like family protein [Alloscardovia macacae]OZG53731.1 YcaO-like family [Alloscardovia macacae]
MCSSSFILGKESQISSLLITEYNRDIPWLKSKHTNHEWDSVKDMLETYSPFGEIKTVLTSLRPGIGFNGYQGSATAMSLDHVLRRITGLPSLPAGLDRDIYGGGKGLCMEDSVLSSLGEAIERMIGAFSSLDLRRNNDEEWASVNDLDRDGKKFIGPDELKLFAMEQFKNPNFLCEVWEKDAKLLWIKGTNLLNGDEIYVPSQLIHLFYIRQTGEARIGVSSSGGLATHRNSCASLAHGILELIERDAANLSWFCKIPPRPIRFDRKLRDRDIERWLESAKRAGTDITFYAHRTDCKGVTVVTAISVEKDLDEYCYLAGGGVGVTPEQAIRSAIAELVQSERMVRIPLIAPNWRLVHGFNRLFGIHKEADNDDFDNFIQVVPFYGYSDNQKKLDWYLRDSEIPEVMLSELPTELSELDEFEAALEICRTSNLTPIAFDLTPINFESIALTKVFIPELVPAFPPNMQMLGHERYSIFRRKMGESEYDLSFDDLETNPLPYP